MKILTLLMVFVMLLSIPSVTAKEVVDKEFVDGEYKSLGDLLGIGDRAYIETYKDGSSELVFERTTNKLAKFFSKLSKATIVEYQGTVWATAPKDVPNLMRVRGVNLPNLVVVQPCSQTFEGMGAQSCTIHVFELSEVLTNGEGEAFISLTTEAEYPVNFMMPMIMVIPGRSPSKATFTVYERVKLLTPYTDPRTGTTYQYIGGSQTYSTEATFDVIWTQATQGGTEIGITPSVTPIQTTAPTNPNWVPSPAPVEIMVISNPPGADVSLSGANIGKTGSYGIPVTVSGSTERTLVLALSGYKTVYMKVSAATISPITVNMEQLPTGTPQTTTPPIGSQTKYQCSNGQWVSDTSLCPVSTSTTSPQQTSGMTLETPTSAIARTPSPVQTPYNTPMFDSILPIIGIFITAYMILRRKPPKEPKQEK